MFTLFAKSTRAERVSDTVFFKHKYLTQPTILPEDTIVAAAQQLTAALKGNAKHHKELEALTKVADLFESIAREKNSNCKTRATYRQRHPTICRQLPKRG